MKAGQYLFQFLNKNSKSTEGGSHLFRNTVFPRQKTDFKTDRVYLLIGE